jgi:hypothetical protein
MTAPTSQTTQLRDIIKKEYKKCIVDPIYFMRKYCVIQHPLRGKIPFNLYKFQEETLNGFLDHRFSIVLKARQIGLSTLVAGYALWLMLFTNDQNVLVIATKQDTAKNLVTKVRVMHQNLPVWLRGDCIEDNKLSLAFSNGSQIKAIASSPDAGRSESLSLLILDEGAFIDGAEDIWTAAFSTLSTGGKGIILSTPNGMGNFFHKTWIAAGVGENNFFPIFLNWAVHPERDQVWRDEQTKQLGDIGARQEHDADFIASGNTVIPGDIIQFYRQTFEKPPIAKRAFDNNLWVWEYATPTKAYMVVADVARGDSNDYSAFHVIELESVTQVAEYRGKIGTKEFGAMLVAIATEYNDALLVIENSTVGWSVLQVAIDRGYKNLFYMEEDWHFVDAKHPRQRTTKRRYFERKSVPGFTTSVRTRPLIISKLDEYMRDNAVVVQSQRTLEELEVFIWKGSRSEAMEGYNDDLVISLSIALWVRDTALRMRQHSDALTRTALDHMSHHTQYEGIYSPQSPVNDPYRMPLGGPTRLNDTEDLRWLLD